jgi:TetR/AcrR family transcriptional regulator, tetracycline repressor protein
MPASAPVAHSGFEVIPKMATSQMIAMDQVLAEFEVPDADPGRWAGRLADVADQLRAVIGRHRDIVPSSIGFLPGGGRALRCHERVLAIMRAGGLSDSLSAAGLHLLWVIVKGFSLEEAPTWQPERIDPDLSPEVSQYFAALPGDRFPNLSAVAGEFAATNLDERFELLIGIFIDGLAGRAGQS